MKIKMTISKTGCEIFENMGMRISEYVPAYNGESAGLDLYNMGPEIVLQNHHKWTAFDERPTMIPTGVHVCLPASTVGLIKERGSITKTGLISRAGVIDPGYTGEIFVNLVNIGSKKVSIPTGAKLPVQLVVLPCLNDYETVSHEEYLKNTQDSKRLSGSLGSSDI